MELNLGEKKKCEFNQSDDAKMVCISLYNTIARRKQKSKEKVALYSIEFVLKYI